MAPRLHADGISLMVPDPDWWKAPRSASPPFHELLYVVAGDMPVAAPAVQSRLKPQEWCYLPPGTRHATGTVGNMGLRFFTVQWTEPDAVSPGRAFVGKDPEGRLLTVLYWLLEVVRGVPAQRQPVMAQALLQTVIAALQPTSSSRAAGRGIDRAIALMHEHLHRHLRIHELAAYAGLGRDTFLRRFQERTGSTPTRYLTGLRIERARTLLRETDMPLHEIARRCGYHDVPRLCHVMVLHTGRQPGAWRAAREAGRGPDGPRA